MPCPAAYRHRLEKHKLTEQILATVIGILTDRGLLLKAGTVVDATLMVDVKHFCSHYKRHQESLNQPARSYTWVKSALPGAALVPKVAGRGKHRKKRDPKPLVGMIHQDASTHAWVPGAHWDLVITMDDATSEHLSMFFCEQEGTASSFHGIGQTIARYGLFCSFYTDRGAHYFTTPLAGGKVDKAHLTQVGRACKQLGIEHIAAYSPRHAGAVNEPFAPTRIGWSKNWPSTALRPCRRPMFTWSKPTAPNTTRSLLDPVRVPVVLSLPT